MTDKPSKISTIERGYDSTREWNERLLESASKFTAYAVSVAALVESVVEAVTLLTTALDEFTKAQAGKKES